MSSVRPPRLLIVRAALLLAGGLLFPNGLLRAQDYSESAAEDAGPPENTPTLAPTAISQIGQPGVQGLPANSGLGYFGQNPTNVIYPSVLTTTGAGVNSTNILNNTPPSPYSWNYHNLNPNLAQTQRSASIESEAHLPFRHAPEPEDANIKAGPFFIKFHSLEGLVIADDNYLERQTDRKSELLVLLRLNMTIIAQLSDNLQFALSGSLDYLPIQNKFGAETSLNLGLIGPLIAGQFVYDTVIDGWPVRFADDFGVGTAVYSSNVVDNYDLFRGDQVERDENGRYTFNYYQSKNAPNAPSTPIVYFDNTVSALTTRLLPDDIRLTVRMEHQNLWYNQENRGLPDERDDFLTSLESERSDERFKPFLSYEAMRVDPSNQGVLQSVKVGITGPIDDYVFLRASIGYAFGERNSYLLYALSLDHTAGRYTIEHLSIGSELDYFGQEDVTYQYYRLDQILGPTLTGSLFLTHATYQNLTGDGGSSFDQELGGLEFSWNVGPRTSLSLAGIYGRQGEGGGGKRDTATGRIILNHMLTDTLTFQLLYQYQHAVSDRAGQSYYENLVYLRIVKLLN